jgi:hypothetical protein
MVARLKIKIKRRRSNGKQKNYDSSLDESQTGYGGESQTRALIIGGTNPLRSGVYPLRFTSIDRK